MARMTVRQFLALAPDEQPSVMAAEALWNDIGRLETELAEAEAKAAPLRAALQIIDERTTHLPNWAATDSPADVFLSELWAVAHKALSSDASEGQAIDLDEHTAWDLEGIPHKEGTDYNIAGEQAGKGWLSPEVKRDVGLALAGIQTCQRCRACVNIATAALDALGGT